jgi:hypothetical protein
MPVPTCDIELLVDWPSYPVVAEGFGWLFSSFALDAPFCVEDQEATVEVGRPGVV